MKFFFLSFFIFPILSFGLSPFIGISTGICIYKNNKTNEYNSISEETHRFRFGQNHCFALGFQFNKISINTGIGYTQANTETKSVWYQTAMHPDTEYTVYHRSHLQILSIPIGFDHMLGDKFFFKYGIGLRNNFVFLSGSSRNESLNPSNNIVTEDFIDWGYFEMKYELDPFIKLGIGYHFSKKTSIVFDNFIDYVYQFNKTKYSTNPYDRFGFQSTLGIYFKL